jgi:hypothetical protein
MEGGMPRRRISVAFLLVALGSVAGSPPARADEIDAIGDSSLMALRLADAYVASDVQGWVGQARLAYAARTASHAADGAKVRVAFVNVPNARLDEFRDRLFRRLRLGDRGALIVGTPRAVAVRTATLTPDQENGILALEGPTLLRLGHTNGLAELIYDVGLVIHNSTPGVHPRGLGLERNLRTFSGRFSDESRGARIHPLTVAAIGLGAVALLAVAALVGAPALRWRRR